MNEYMLNELSELVDRQIDTAENTTACLSDLRKVFTHTVSGMIDECEMANDDETLGFMENALEASYDWGGGLESWVAFLYELSTWIPSDFSPIPEECMETDIEGEVHFRGERLG